MNDEAVYRTAPATPGLLTSLGWVTFPGYVTLPSLVTLTKLM